MSINNSKNYINILKYKPFLWLIIIHSFVAILIISKGVLLLPYFFLFAITYYIVYKHPIIAILILLAILYPTVFQMTPSYNEGYSFIGGGLRAEDVVILLMGCAVIQKLFISGQSYNKMEFKKYIVFFFLLLFFDIFRNISQYGIAAFGEFRFSYLILVLPVYIALFFDTIELRKRLFLIIIFSSIFAILLSVPFIASSKGWVIGNTEYDRFLSSQISLGLIYGFIALILSKKYNIIKISLRIILIITIPVFILLIADGHRSVWLALVVAIISLYRLREFKIAKLSKWGVWIFILIMIVFIVFQNENLSLFDYIRERLIAFTSPKNDPNSLWRLAVWDASLKNFFNAPLFGHGFGGYWHTFVAELNLTTNFSPHNLYIHTLVKTGLAGLILYLIIVYKLYKKLKTTLYFIKGKNNIDIPIIIFSIVVLVSSFFYYMVYSFDYFPMLYLGLGAASILDNKNDLEID